MRRLFEGSAAAIRAGANIAGCDEEHEHFTKAPLLKYSETGFQLNYRFTGPQIELGVTSAEDMAHSMSDKDVLHLCKHVSSTDPNFWATYREDHHLPSTFDSGRCESCNTLWLFHDDDDPGNCESA